jgi:hypothetical protein
MKVVPDSPDDLGTYTTSSIREMSYAYSSRAIKMIQKDRDLKVESGFRLLWV